MILDALMVEKENLLDISQELTVRIETAKKGSGYGE